MQSRRVSVAVALVAIGVSVGGCGYQRHFVPAGLSQQYELREWPRGTPLRVEDVRAERTDDSSELVERVRFILSQALLKAERPETVGHNLTVSIKEHEVALRGPWWNARTRFRVMAFDGRRLLKQWDAVGEDRRWNAMPAYMDAREAAQKAFERAVNDLMMKLKEGP